MAEALDMKVEGLKELTDKLRGMGPDISRNALRAEVRAGIEPDMRVTHDGMTYNIKAVLPDPTLRRHLTLMCETGVSNG